MMHLPPCWRHLQLRPSSSPPLSHTVHHPPTNMNLWHDCCVASSISLLTSPLYCTRHDVGRWPAGCSTWKTAIVRYNHNSAVKIQTDAPHESTSDGELLGGLSWMGVAVEGCCLAAVLWRIGPWLYV
jgi:hypothetical protein